MYRKNVLSVTKKLTAGFLAAVMTVVGMVIVPQIAEAAVVEDEVIYDKNYKISDYWEMDSKKAPIKEGYVFGGWYADGEGKDYLTEKEAATATNAYAKFVPASVLSVKAQNMAGTGTDENIDKTYVRVITSLDSKDYQKVGFDIWLANKTQLFKDKATKSPLETTKIYKGLLVGTDKEDAEEIFGGVSKYVGVWQLTNVAESNWGKIIYVRPYWITMDGTKVEGLAKYVHIEDEYKGYISVPVNLLTGEDVAAGVLSMTYDNALTFVEFEEGRLLPTMKYYLDEPNKTIKMVGNASEVDSNVSADGIFANIRFKEPDADTQFDIKISNFSNWAEKLIDTVKAWDIKYVK